MRWKKLPAGLRPNLADRDFPKSPAAFIRQYDQVMESIKRLTDSKTAHASPSTSVANVPAPPSTSTANASTQPTPAVRTSSRVRSAPKRFMTDYVDVPRPKGRKDGAGLEVVGEPLEPVEQPIESDATDDRDGSYEGQLGLSGSDGSDSSEGDEEEAPPALNRGSRKRQPVAQNGAAKAKSTKARTSKRGSKKVGKAAGGGGTGRLSRPNGSVPPPWVKTSQPPNNGRLNASDLTLRRQHQPKPSTTSLTQTTRWTLTPTGSQRGKGRDVHSLVALQLPLVPAAPHHPESRLLQRARAEPRVVPHLTPPLLTPPLLAAHLLIKSLRQLPRSPTAGSSRSPTVTASLNCKGRSCRWLRVWA